MVFVRVCSVIPNVIHAVSVKYQFKKKNHTPTSWPIPQKSLPKVEEKDFHTKTLYQFFEFSGLQKKDNLHQLPTEEILSLSFVK